LNASSASQQISIDNINSATASFSTIVNGLSAKTGSYATTGSNIFVGNQTITGSLILSSSNAVELTVIGNSDITGSESVSGSLSLIGPFVVSDGGNAASMVTRSGSIVLVGSGFTSSSVSLQHISSSANFVNFFMKNTDTAADTIISGSGNIFLNPGAATAGFKRFMTGGNIAVGGQGQGIPQISASMAWSPIIANNIFANSANPITFRGPVSSSQSLLNNNIFAGGALNLGVAAASNFEKASSGVQFQSNIINGTVNAVTSITTLTNRVDINNNNFGGNTNILINSSSVLASNNTHQGTITLTNNYDRPAGATTNTFTYQRNVVFGTNMNLFISGSNGSNATRISEGNLIAGIHNSASLNLVGELSNLNATAIIGHGLNVTGSSSRYNNALSQSIGSAFFGRHNDQLGNKAKSAETIFAIGTGTPTVPKTGFLIDSGSNVFVEGTLNISGSTTMTGSLILSSSNAVELFVIGDTQFTGGVFVSGSGIAGTDGATMVVNSRLLLTGPTTGNTPNLTVSGSDAVATTRRFAWDINSQNTSTINPSLTMYAHPSASTTISMGVYDPITFADSGEFLVQTTKNGTKFDDFQDGGAFSYNTWLTIPRNDGSNPKPIFNRGLEVTSSLNINGNLRVDSPFSASIGNGLNVSGNTILSGNLTVASGSSFFANGNKQFNVGAFQSNVTQSGSANVSQSMNFGTTDISQGVSIVSNSRITLANSGTYNIQFSAQFDRIAGSGNDVVNVWLKKNGVNYNASAGALTLSGGANQAKAIAAWNYVVDTLNTDYWELCWQSTDNNIQLISFPASGNIPSIPSVILTVTQVR
jgi:hypothetical protein